MFGLKQKEKEIENEQIVENNVLEENVEETSLIEVQEESKTDKFDLAKILGKTEDGLKNEFYVYQIKELMSKLGLCFLDKSLSFNSIVKQIKDAKELGVSASFLSRIFKKEIGIPIHEYLNQYRISKSLSLLKTHSITEVGYICGFCDNSHFISIFKKYIGTTPMQYKKQHL
jgi:AraC-like DNA-binding protein